MALSGLAAAKMARAEPASYTNLDEPSGRSTYAAGINSAGQIVGLYTDVAGSNHGFIDTAGSYTTLDDPLGASTEALGINDSGQVVGFYNNIYSHGFVYNSGKYTSLDDPAATNGTVAFGVNDLGEVVGNYGDSGGFVHGFLYNGGTYTTLDDPLALSTYATGINSGGEIVGFYYDASAPAGFPGPGANGFVYNAGAYTTLRDPLGVNGTFAYGINDSGQIVGFYYDATDTAHGFVYQGGAYITLNGPLNGACGRHRSRHQLCWRYCRVLWWERRRLSQRKGRSLLRIFRARCAGALDMGDDAGRLRRPRLCSKSPDMPATS